MASFGWNTSKMADKYTAAVDNRAVSADGFEYEVRNRVTLCRCGQSQNKPFCDGTHAQTKFKDT